MNWKKEENEEDEKRKDKGRADRNSDYELERNSEQDDSSWLNDRGVKFEKSVEGGGGLCLESFEESNLEYFHLYFQHLITSWWTNDRIHSEEFLVG